MANKLLASGLLEVNTQITEYEQRYGREAQAVRLIAVSKTKPASAIRAAYELGETRFGENYLQEALAKKAELASLEIEWHFIGHIQSRKAKVVAHHFDWVHCVDGLKLAVKLDAARPAGLGALNVLIQVNLQLEASKSGVAPSDVADLAKEISALSHLCLRGLMIIPKRAATLAQQRAVFSEARILLDSLNQLGYQMNELSMGMTGDLEAAIAEGATMVRIGTAVFGERAAKAIV